MNKTKKEWILEGFQKMNWNMLDVLLDENLTYQGAKKEVFLEKINDMFSEFKESGDTFLSTHQGFCSSDQCPNKGCRGYSFVGNTSNKYISFIFEELNDDIKDIYHCSGFSTDDSSVKREIRTSINIDFDERADFKPSLDFLIKSQKCSLAYEALMCFKNVVISKEVYLEWLDKFYPLYKSFENPPIFYSDFNKFYWLYSSITGLKEYLQFHCLAKEALKEFKIIDNTSERQLLKWLVKYEKTGMDLILFAYDGINFEHPNKTEYFKVRDLKISISDFKHIAKFKFLFDRYYWEMLEKYSTASKEEGTIYYNKEIEMSDFTSSLTYHLEQRGIKL